MGGIRWSWRQLHPSERVETWERRQLHVSGACCATAARAEGHDMGVELLRLRAGYVWAGFTEVGADPLVARSRIPGASAGPNLLRPAARLHLCHRWKQMRPIGSRWTSQPLPIRPTG